MKSITSLTLPGLLTRTAVRWRSPRPHQTQWVRIVDSEPRRRALLRKSKSERCITFLFLDSFLPADYISIRNP